MSRVRQAPGATTVYDWQQAHNPSANTKATCTQPAQPAGSLAPQNVCTGFTVLLAAGSTAPAAATVTVALIDGVSGGTKYLWGPHTLSIPAVAGALNGIARQPLWISGSPNTAMTLEFSAAAGANTIESVSMEGTQQ